MEERDINIDLFEKYLEGALEEKELSEFEARLTYDANFKHEFEEYKDVEDGIRMHFHNEMKSRFNEIDNDLDGNSQKSIGRNRQLILWTSSIAASVLIGVLLLQHFSTDGNELLAKQYWTEELGLPVKMSDKSKYDDAMNAFKLEEWEKAEELLKKIKSDTSQYFLGVIAFEESNFKKASEYFKQIEVSSTYYEKAQFRLALVYLANGEVSLSKNILSSLVNHTNQFSEEAKEILKKI